MKHDNSQRPKKHDLQAMIATLGADDDNEDETDGKYAVLQCAGVSMRCCRCVYQVLCSLYSLVIADNENIS